MQWTLLPLNAGCVHLRDARLGDSSMQCRVASAVKGTCQMHAIVYAHALLTIGTFRSIAVTFFFNALWRL